MAAAAADDAVLNDILGRAESAKLAAPAPAPPLPAAPAPAPPLPAAPAPGAQTFEALQRRDDNVIAQLLLTPASHSQETPRLPPDNFRLEAPHVAAAPHGADTSAQQRSDDAVLSQILAGGTPKASKARGQVRRDLRFAPRAPVETSQERDDRALAEVLGQVPPSMAGLRPRSPQDDDHTLSMLLASAIEDKRSPSSRGFLVQSPLQAVLDEVLRGARAERNYLRAEVVAGGYGRGDGPHQLCRPLGIAVDAHGAVIVADNGNGRVVRWKHGASQGEVVLDRDGRFADPFGVVIDTTGSLVVSSGSSVYRTRLHSREEADSQMIIAGEWLTGLAVDSYGAILAADAFDHSVVRCGGGSVSGREVVISNDGMGARFDQLHRPSGIVTLADGSIVVVDSGNHRVVRWERGGWHSEVVAGGNGRGCRLDQLSYPRSVVVDSHGRLLISDTANHRIVSWAPGAAAGKVVAGGRGQGSRIDQLSKPVGLAFDGLSLFIADSGNHRVVRWPLAPHPGARR